MAELQDRNLLNNFVITNSIIAIRYFYLMMPLRPRGKSTFK